MKQVGLITTDNEFERTFRTAISILGYLELSVYKDVDSVIKEFHLDLLVIDCKVTIEDELECKIKQLESVTSKILLFSEDYNIQQFKKMRSISPVGYLEKIANPLQIVQAVDLALWKKSKLSSKEQPNYYFNEFQEQLFVKVGCAYKTLLIQEILYIFSKEKMNYLKTISIEYPISETMKNLSADLHPLLIRVHRSYLVNINLIEKINLKEGYLVVANTQLPIGKKYKDNLLENLTIIK